MTEPIHVQHVLLSLQPGGLENGVVNVVNRLDSAHFRSSVCCLKTAGPFAARITAPGVAVHEMNWRGGNNPGLVLRLAHLFRRTRTQVVHTRNAESFFYGFLAGRLAGIPAIVHSEHGRTFDDRALRFTIQRWMSARTNKIFALSDQLRQDLQKHVGIPAARIELIYNGVDLDKFAGRAPPESRQALGCASDDFVVGSVGRLVPVKNYALLLRAAARTRIPNLRVMLIGDGPERAALTELAQSLGILERVIFLGHREDVGRLLPALDVFVLPSISEGLSNTLLEAMAAGIPVVASNVGGNAETIRSHNEGMLFESRDEAALCIAVETLWREPALRASMAAAGRARIDASFSMKSMIGAYENIYFEALRR